MPEIGVAGSLPDAHKDDLDALGSAFGAPWGPGVNRQAVNRRAPLSKEEKGRELFGCPGPVFAQTTAPRSRSCHRVRKDFKMGEQSLYRVALSECK
jgi:hypothetical protein